MNTDERLYWMGIALETFRREYGVKANPEDYPELWEPYLIVTDGIEDYLLVADEISEEET